MKLILKGITYFSFLKDSPGHAFQTALMNVASGIEKNTPQNPNILPNINTARIIIIGCSFTASEKIKGTSKLPSMN